MSQILNVAGESSGASDAALQARVSSIRSPGSSAWELTQWPATQRASHGACFMAANADLQSSRVNEPDQ
ncbi:hypothetical protein [Thiohalophilus sp.]|uniref:hypothetical protein n=1 Tax=Thiohalophilus sp. TaxID=3028392 RepID=UPI003974E061